jgi:hypothetical protein
MEILKGISKHGINLLFPINSLTALSFSVGTAIICIPEFTAERIRHWLLRIGVKTLFIEPGSPWENGYVESFNGKLRDELLNCEVFDTLTEAKVLIERWRKQYNEIRPHSSLGNVPPEQFAAQNLPLKTDPIRAPGTIKNDLQNFKLT